MAFIDFSVALSFDFGRRRKTELPDGLVLEEIDIEADTLVSEKESDAKVQMGFRPNEEREMEQRLQ